MNDGFTFIGPGIRRSRRVLIDVILGLQTWALRRSCLPIPRSEVGKWDASNFASAVEEAREKAEATAYVIVSARAASVKEAHPRGQAVLVAHIADDSDINSVGSHS